MWERGVEQGKIQENKPRSRAHKKSKFLSIPAKRLSLASLDID